MLFDHSDTELFLVMVMLQLQSSHHNMPRKGGKKKAKATKEDLDLEVLPRMEIIYEDMKAVTGSEQEFKWGHIYHMIKDQNVPYVSLEYIPLYVNIIKTGITKVSMRPKLFPCAEVIRWIIPQANTGTMIISNTEGQAFASFTPAYITKVWKLLAPKIMMTNELINSLSLDLFECSK